MNATLQLRLGALELRSKPAMSAAEIFRGSDGQATKQFYAELSSRGILGAIAVDLFRAQKCSDRAKVYRGGIRGVGSFRRMAYDRKSWSMKNLAERLDKTANQTRIAFGWKRDPRVLFGERASWVLYVDLPQGQVSFHSQERFAGPDYPGEWDGSRASLERIIAFCEAILNPAPSFART